MHAREFLFATLHSVHAKRKNTLSPKTPCVYNTAYRISSYSSLHYTRELHMNRRVYFLCSVKLQYFEVRILAGNMIFGGKLESHARHITHVLRAQPQHLRTVSPVYRHPSHTRPGNAVQKSMWGTDSLQPRVPTYPYCMRIWRETCFWRETCLLRLA